MCHKIMTNNEKLGLNYMQLAILFSLLFMVLHLPAVNEIIM